MAPKDLLSVAQAAEYLGISTTQLYLFRAAGKIAFYRSGQGRGTYRFSKDDLDAYIASKRVPAKGEKAPVPISYQPASLVHVQPRAPRSKKAGG